MACWLEESLSMLLLVGVPVPCRRGLLSWGCIILDTTIVCFPSGRRNVASREAWPGMATKREGKNHNIVNNYKCDFRFDATCTLNCRF